MKNLKVGLVGTSQLSFPGDKEGQFDRSARELEGLSKRLGFELHVCRDTVVNEPDAERAVKEAEGNGVDFLLIQCTSFSSGFLIPILARVKNARVGLWAIPESASEGAVPFNSFCSVNMYSSIIGHYLKRYRIPFKWFYGNAGHALFDRRLEVTVAALTAIKKLRQSKVALIGGIAPGFDDLYFDERDILKTFDGMRINRLHEFSEIKDRALGYKAADVEPIARQMAAGAKGVHPASAPLLETSARVYRAYTDLAREYGYDALAVSCWPKFQTDFRYSVCSVVAQLNDEGVVAACEGDLPSAVSMLMLRHLSGRPAMLMDFSDFDEADQTILMWHCGPAPKEFCGDGGYTLGVNYHGLPHVKGKEPSCCGVVRDMVFKPGHVTIARLAGECGRMFLAGGDFIGDAKKSFHGSRGWLGDLSLNREAISVRDFVNTVLVQKFQHHYPIAGGDCSGEVMEAAAWLGLGMVGKVGYQEYLQNGESV